MKTTFCLSLAAAALLMGACQSNYVVSTRVKRNGAVERTVLSADTTVFLSSLEGWACERLPEPEWVDFYNCGDTMRYAFRHAEGQLPALDGPGPAFGPKETVERRFLWFVTRYDYKAVYSAWEDLPVPLGNYLEPEQVRLITRGGQWPAQWNGSELYQMLDSVQGRYRQWVAAVWYEAEYRALLPYAAAEQRAQMERCHDSLLAKVRATDDWNEWGFVRMASGVPELDFVASLKAAHEDEVESEVNMVAERLMGLQDAVVHRVSLPGMAEQSYKVDGVRLLAEGMEVRFGSWKVNWWACGLTAAVLLLAGVALALRRRG